MTINGSANDDISIAFSDATDFIVTSGGGTPTAYTTSAINKVVYNGPAGAFSKLIFSDSSNTDAYAVTQAFASTTLVQSGGAFEFDAIGVGNLYLYVSDPNSTASVGVAAGTGNFFVGAANAGYSYIANPNTGVYSELSGFGSETVTGSAGTTYAYLYSTSHTTTVASPSQTTFTVGGVMSTLSNFSQVYVVGAKDGTDSVTLDSSGGTFVSSPQFSYVSGTSSGSSFLLGALYAAQVTGQASTSGQDTAVFYSYPNDTFTGTAGTSELSGGTTNLAGSNVNFVSQALGLNGVSVFESGSGSDVANLTSPGGGSFFSTSAASTLSTGTSTITVNSYSVSDGPSVAIPSQIVVTGSGTDSATIYDSSGNNALTASGSTATLTTALGSLSINKFGSIVANQQNGSNDTVHEGAIHFALKTVGNWTSD